jgi:hypothetical protein
LRVLLEAMQHIQRFHELGHVYKILYATFTPVKSNSTRP